MKKLIGLLFGLMFLFTGTAYAELVAYYAFDGDTLDYSGNGNDGTAYGGISYIEGKLNQAAYFDGLDDHIQLPTTDVVFSSGQPRKISATFWIKPGAVGTA